jgi:hypothetical protein
LCDEDWQFAHVWSVYDQHKKGYWGFDANHDGQLLNSKCHKICDSLLKASTA